MTNESVNQSASWRANTGLQPNKAIGFECDRQTIIAQLINFLAREIKEALQFCTALQCQHSGLLRLYGHRVEAAHCVGIATRYRIEGLL